MKTETIATYLLFWLVVAVVLIQLWRAIKL